MKEHQAKDLEANELEALVSLTCVPSLGPVKIRLLIQHFGSAYQTLSADPQEIAQWPGFGPKIIECLKKVRSGDMGRKEIELAAKHNVTLLAYNSPHFPKHLLEIADCPILIYMKGTLNRLDHQGIAVIGTRQMSLYGSAMAKRFSQELAEMGITVVSGLARGIDTIVHQGALERGRTLAVIGSGLANIYPRENRELAETIAQKGALLSEFPMTTPPDRQNFPQRNRIVSGMTRATLLIEAPPDSGAMITMEKAEKQGRPTFAIPGRLDMENFKGNHWLLKKGKAKLVESARDMMGYFDDFFGTSPGFISAPMSHLPLEKEEERVFNRIPDDEVSIEELAGITELPISQLNVLIMGLVLKKAIKEFPGKLYKKIR